MAGAGYKLFNTGDVLTAAQVNTYLMEQTTMVFADAAARTAALSGVVSEGMISYLKSTKQVEVYNGSAWVASDDPNAIQNTIVDAKGDLIAASAADTPARLAVGNNGETLVADSSQSAGLRYNPPVGSLANPVINGGFDIWQRGTSAVAGTSTGAYFADRFGIARASAGSTATRQTVSDSTNLPNIQYCARIARDSGNTSTNVIYVGQSMESVNSIPYAGKTITISFYARKGANFSGASDALSVVLVTGTGTDQSVWNGLTGSITVINQTATLTSTWQRFTFTATLSSTLTQIGFYASYTPSGTAGANDWFEITGFQIDLGTYTASSAPTFRRAGGTLAGELAACQRYYWRTTGNATNAAKIIAMGTAISTTNANIAIKNPVNMRVAPTSVDYSTLKLYDGVAVPTVTSISLAAGNTSEEVSYLGTVAATGLTQYRPYFLYADGSTAYIGFSAEL